MKTLLSLIMTLFLVFMFTLPAMAKSSVNNKVWGLYSSASAAVETSDAVDVRGYKSKSVTITGATLGSSPESVVQKSMSGTALIQCAPTTTGPWSTCIANDYAQTAISRTTNGIFSWTDSFPYVRIHWTGGTVGGKLKAWLNLSE